MWIAVAAVAAAGLAAHSPVVPVASGALTVDEQQLSVAVVAVAVLDASPPGSVVDSIVAETKQVASSIVEAEVDGECVELRPLAEFFVVVTPVLD